MSEHRLVLGLRAVTAVYAAVFLSAALQNFGARVSVGPVDWYFSVPIWQAAIGEVVIGLALLAASLGQPRRLYWVAYVLSALGIIFGLSATRVVDAARTIHVVLVPLGILGLVLLVLARRDATR